MLIASRKFEIDQKEPLKRWSRALGTPRIELGRLPFKSTSDFELSVSEIVMRRSTKGRSGSKYEKIIGFSATFGLTYDSIPLSGRRKNEEDQETKK